MSDQDLLMSDVHNYTEVSHRKNLDSCDYYYYCYYSYCYIVVVVVVQVLNGVFKALYNLGPKLSKFNTS